MFMDLTERPPRSPRVLLGGYVILARVLDKGRATIAGKNGDYDYDCPLDKHFFDFAGIVASELLEQLKAGKGDFEILEWIHENRKNKHTSWDIQAWSNFHSLRGPSSDEETISFFAGRTKEMNPKREDITTWFALLDTDDFVTFGGKA
jgi:hypothetical protein